jgi:hypothetical protein
VSRPTPEEPHGQGDRCCRCGRPVRSSYTRVGAGPPAPGTVVAARRWPDGPICSSCLAKAMETFGICDGCGVDRLLPGIGTAGQRWCTDCGGGLGDFSCTRCGREGWREQPGVCGWCVLADRVDELLDDGTGRIRPELQPLAELITGMARPRSGILWLSRPAPQGILREIAHGNVPLTHEGIHSIPPLRSSVYVRDLMVAAGILPPVDKFLFLFEQWWPKWLATVADPEHRKMLHYFITWHYLRTFRSSIDTRGELGYSAPQRARRQLRVADWFLDELTDRGRTLDTCTQADLDHYFATGTRSRRADLDPFLRWAMTTNRMPALELPPHRKGPVSLITQQHRIAHIRRIYHGDQMGHTDRVIALLVLLYAQPLARIRHLTIDDVSTDADGQLFIRIADPPAPVPPPFDDIIRQHINSRMNQTTATNPGSRWLFPGRRAGQPLHITSMRLRLSNLGIPNLSSRNRAIRELLRRAPPAIVAGMLNRSTARAEGIAAEYGATWKHYTAGGHPPRRPPRVDG